MSSVPVVTAGGAGRSPSKKNRSNRRKTNNQPNNAVASSAKVENEETEAKKQQLKPEEQTELENGGPLLIELEETNANMTEQPSAETSKQKSPEQRRLGRLKETLHIDALYKIPVNTLPLPNQEQSTVSRNIWLFICFLGIMISFVCYGLLLEYATSGGRKLHELSFLFVTSALYTLTAAAGRYVRDETPTSIPPARFAVLGLTSMGSTFCSVRSLRFVIYPIQVLAKSCKPVPVMIMGALMGKRYPLRKYINVVMIVAGVAMFMGGGNSKKKDNVDVSDTSSQIIGILLLFVSLCFDGGTGAYEDKLMAVHHVGPFDLMYNIQLGKTILAGIGLIVLNQMHEFIRMCQETGFLLIALGLSGAFGQVFIFVTIAKFGALTCSIIGLARKITTLVASIIFFGHPLSSVQFMGLVVSIASMIMNFWGKKKGKGDGHGAPPPPPAEVKEDEIQKLLDEEVEAEGHVELVGDLENGKQERTA